jgi:hypothetical protein
MMRNVDRNIKIGRRGFLAAGSTAVPAAALASAGLGISAQAAWAVGAKALTPHSMATLVLMSRDIYPHDHFPDSLYIAAATPWDDKAGGDAAFKQMLEEGVSRLDADAGDRHGQKYLAVAWEEDRVALLRGIEKTAFFKKCRSDLVVSLYNQPAVWTKLGYEGSSAEHGGYIHRGFDDIDWLSSV